MVALLPDFALEYDCPESGIICLNGEFLRLDNTVHTETLYIIKYAGKCK
jgi:hypothetical protein